MDQVIQEQLTYAQLISKIQDSEIEPGIQYLITNAQASHPECVSSTVLVYGTTNKTVSKGGVRFQLVADYANIPMFNDELADYAIGDKCIYGSRVWVNVTGNRGSSTGSFPMDLLLMNSDWEPAPYEEGVNYTLTQMECKYDAVNDLVIDQSNGLLNIGAPVAYATAFGFSPLDYCDWGQVNIAMIIEVRGLMFLNNSNLQQAINVFAPLIINNLCEIIQKVTVSTSRMTSFEALPQPVIAYNECRNIRAISNTQSILAIPSTVSDYSFVTDDESGYFEHDFNDSPYTVGDTLVLGCIANKGVSLVETFVNCDGNLTEGVSGIEAIIGIDTDNPTYHTFNTADVNSVAESFHGVSPRTTDFNRLVIFTAAANITSGKIFIAYKYV